MLPATVPVLGGCKHRRTIKQHGAEGETAYKTKKQRHMKPLLSVEVASELVASIRFDDSSPGAAGFV